MIDIEVVLVIVAVVMITIGVLFSEKLRKALCGVLVAILVVIACGICMDAAAEEVVIKVTGVRPVILGNELLLEVHFDYKGNELSWYEEASDIFDVESEYIVTIFNNEEVINAEKKGDENQWLRPLSSISGDLLKNVGVRLRSRVSSLY